MFVMLLLVLTPFLAGCGGGGGQAGTLADTDLAVVYFNLENRTDVYRNDMPEIRFTAPVSRDSVTFRTVRILTGPNQQTPQQGALIVDGNKVFFDPTISQNQYDKGGFGAVRDLPYGFAPLTNYQLFIPGYPNSSTVRNFSGGPLLRDYFSSFTTSEGYRPEPIPTQPTFIGVDDPSSGQPSGKLAFIPPAYRDTDPDSPTFNEIVVAYNAEIVMVFDEVLAPGSFVPGDTVVVENITPPFGGSPIPVPGTFRHTNDGKTFIFVPSFHYGTGPFTIKVTINQGVTDLTGNQLRNPVTREFRTEYRENVNTIDFLSETFSNNLHEDLIVTTALWNDANSKGLLVGGPITTSTVTVMYIGDGILTFRTRTPYPLVAETQQTSGTGGIICSGWSSGIRFQTTYSVKDLGGEAAITSIAWGPDSNAMFAATYPNIQLRLGHTDNTEGVLGLNFEENFEDGMPLPQADASYGIPQRANINPPGLDTGYWPYPALTTPFDYDGKRAIVMDLQVSPGGTCQTHRCWFNGAVAGSVRRYAVATDRNAEEDNFTTGGGNSPEVVYDAQIIKKRRITFAQSTWYEARSNDPNYAEAIISPPSQSGGATFILEWQGADGMVHPTNPNKYVPDPVTQTTWNTNTNTLDLKRFVRFRLTLIANLNSNTVPRITSIQLPYEF
jgi:hypothetical protein